MIILYVLGIIILLNLICWWFTKNYELEIEKITKIGRLDARIGIEDPISRDFDITISCQPLWYITFQLSLWSVYCGFGWSRDAESDADCSNNFECHSCGCKNKCGEKQNETKRT